MLQRVTKDLGLFSLSHMTAFTDSSITHFTPFLPRFSLLWYDTLLFFPLLFSFDSYLLLLF